MRPISRSAHASLHYLTPQSLEAIHSKLHTVLGEADKAFFAKPERRASETIWYVDEQFTVVPSAQLTEQEKDEVADLIDGHRSRISAKIQAVPELRPLAEMLFRIPGQENLHVLRGKDGRLSIMVSQWACSSRDTGSNQDPYSTYVNRPRPDRTPVHVRISFSDGSPAGKMEFLFTYADARRSFLTNEEGEYAFGRMKFHSQFLISLPGNPGMEKAFTVMPDQEWYQWVIPQPAEAEVRITDQDGQPVSGRSVGIQYGASAVSMVSDELGIVYVPDLEAGTHFEVFQADNPSNRVGVNLLKGLNRFSLEIRKEVLYPVSVCVKDENDQPVPGRKVNVQSDAGRLEGETDEHGFFELPPQPIDRELDAWDTLNQAVKAKHAVVDGSNVITLKLPSVPPVRVRLIDPENKPVPDIPFELAGTKLEAFKATTDQEGYIHLKASDFEDKEKVRATIHLPRKGKKDKVIRKRFTYRKEQQEYVLKLRRMRWWWLLLLLPLLLLIKCEKDVYVQTLSAHSGQPVANEIVSFEYREAYLFHKGRFFTNDLRQLSDTTDATGTAIFASLGYSVYSHIFHFGSKARIYAGGQCLASDTLKPRYHGLSHKDTVKLPVSTRLTSLDFRVVDKLDDEPIPDAWVVIESRYGPDTFIDSAKTGADGRVVFERAPVCGEVVKVKGSAEGFRPDSMVGKKVAELTGDLDSLRKLRLDPLRDQIKFFVEDCVTRRRIPGAEVEIEFDISGKKTKQKKRTNVNGVGKGILDDAYLIADVTLEGKAPPYYKPGKLPTYKVRDFINLPDSARTICLEPIPNAVDFMDVDSLTQRGIAGVTNTITIKNGGTTRTETAISNKDGVFVVVINPGDEISIHASYPPDYLDNDRTIRNADGLKLKDGPASGRKIPLSPRMVELPFRTLDADNGNPVPLADLVVSFTVNGTAVSIPSPSQSDGNGSFRLLAPVTANVSIRASKAGYGYNDTKIANASVKSLETAPQSERDIPLKMDPPPPPPPDDPCSNSFASGGAGVTVNVHEMKGVSSFILSYDMRNLPDKLEVFCGGPNGRLLATTWVSVSLTGTLNISMRDCKGGTVTVVVTGDEANTEWSYEIICP